MATGLCSEIIENVLFKKGTYAEVGCWISVSYWGTSCEYHIESKMGFVSGKDTTWQNPYFLSKGDHINKTETLRQNYYQVPILTSNKERSYYGRFI